MPIGDWSNFPLLLLVRMPSTLGRSAFISSASTLSETRSMSPYGSYSWMLAFLARRNRSTV